MKIQNPILPGFHPDPSIVRVGKDYYIAVSTFHWFPGVAIYHSTNLQNWTLVARPLTTTTQLDMRGNEPSGGIFAPCLTYSDGVFYLLYTNVRAHRSAFMDAHNYMVTTTDIQGEWSEPTYLQSAGFDPSLFHDDDGKKYVMSVSRRFRSDENGSMMNGIVLQEYDRERQCFVGEMKNISLGSGITTPEGAHIYKRNGYYYLLHAEGGTQYGHACTMARSRSLFGPYEFHPANPILSARDSLASTIQCAGHGDLVENPEGTWYLVHLGTRPLAPFRNSILGRETMIQCVEWREDDWLYLIGEGHLPKTEVETTQDEAPRRDDSVRYDFSGKELSPDFLSLRIPLDSVYSFEEQEGCLTLTGKDSPNSRFEQTLFARRQQSVSYSVETMLDFHPINERQMAGLTLIYDEDSFHYLYLTTDYHGKICIESMTMNRGQVSFQGRTYHETSEKIQLRAEVDGVSAQFYFRIAKENWTSLGQPLDMRILSDEHQTDGGYTGTMVGFAAHDMLYRNAKAHFYYFDYNEQE